MAVGLHHRESRERTPRNPGLRLVPSLTAGGAWTLCDGSTAELTVRRLGHRESVYLSPLTGHIVSDDTGALLASVGAPLGERPGSPELVFRSRRILAEGDGRMTIPGSLVVAEQPLEVSFHGSMLPPEPGDDDRVFRAQAHAELDRAGMRFLAAAMETAVLHLGHGRLQARIVAEAEQ